jgi:hypothetical protein
MSRRVYIGNNGSGFRFRTSLPGYDAATAADFGLTIWEGMTPMTPKESGAVSLGSGGSPTTPVSATIGLSNSWAYPPLLIMKATNGIVPGKRTYFAIFNANANQITFTSRMSPSVIIKWFAYDELNF